MKLLGNYLLPTKNKFIKEGTFLFHVFFFQLFNEQRMTELRQRLRNVLWNSLSDLIQVEQTLMYFVNRLQADTLTDRIVAAEVFLNFNN